MAYLATIVTGAYNGSSVSGLTAMSISPLPPCSIRCSLRLGSSARNKDQKLVGHFLKIGYFIGYYTAVPLKMYGKYGRSKEILIGQMLKLVGKWPVADCYF